MISVETILKKLNDSSSSNKTNGVFGLSVPDILWLNCQFIKVIKEQPVMIELSAPVVIVGDIHGQYSWLLKVFELGGEIPQTKYVFLGDYVGRGPDSIEVLSLLFCLKIKWPDHIFLIRGNHESGDVSRYDGFYEETIRKHVKDAWYAFNDTFKWLPAAAVVNKRIFCVHGGLSPELESIQQIMEIKRPYDIPIEGLMSDIFWSDPFDGEGFVFNEDRGTSFFYGHDVVEKFLKKHSFDLLCRAHQVITDGYEFPFPGAVTVFSSPYDDSLGAILVVHDNLECSFHVFGD